MIAAIVLAAGLGTRMRRIKPLIEFGGEPSLAILLRRLRAAGIARPIVVLGRSAKQIRDRVDLSEADVVLNPHPEHGMAGSLALGLRAVPLTADGTIVLHADMPFIEKETIHAVLRTAERGARIAAPSHRGRRGFPVYLSRAAFPELLATLAGDVGAREYIARHTEDLVLAEVDGDGCLRDIDTPEDLSAAREESHAVHADR